MSAAITSIPNYTDSQLTPVTSAEKNGDACTSETLLPGQAGSQVKLTNAAPAFSGYEPITASDSPAQPASPTQIVKDKELSQATAAVLAMGSTGHPWFRYFARMIDTYLGIMLFMPLWVYLVLAHPLWFHDPDSALFLLTLSGFYLVVIVEGILIFLLGTTPGKFLMGIRVLDSNGKPPSFAASMKRAVLVLVYGNFLYIPIANIFASATAHGTIKSSGKATWDSASAQVKHLTTNRFMIAVGFIALIITIYPIKSGEWMKTLIGSMTPAIERGRESKLNAGDLGALSEFIDQACIETNKILPKQIGDTTLVRLYRESQSVVYEYKDIKTDKNNTEFYKTNLDELQDRTSAVLLSSIPENTLFQKCQRYAIPILYRYLDINGRIKVIYTFNLNSIGQRQAKRLADLTSKKPDAIRSFIAVECASFNQTCPIKLDESTTLTRAFPGGDSVITYEYVFDEAKMSPGSDYVAIGGRVRLSTLTSYTTDKSKSDFFQTYKKFGIQLEHRYRNEKGDEKFKYLIDLNSEEFRIAERISKLEAHDQMAISSYLDELTFAEKKSVPKRLDGITTFTNIYQEEGGILVYEYHLDKLTADQERTLTEKSLRDSVIEMVATDAGFSPMRIHFQKYGIRLRFRYLDSRETCKFTFIIDLNKDLKTVAPK